VSNQRKRFRSKCLVLILVAMTLLLVLYVSSYTVLSARGIGEAQEMDAPGFLYVAREDVAKARNEGDESLRRILATHQQRRILFAPIECLNRLFLGGMRSASGGTWQLYETRDLDVESGGTEKGTSLIF